MFRGARGRPAQSAALLGKAVMGLTAPREVLMAEAAVTLTVRRFPLALRRRPIRAKGGQGTP